MKTKIQQFKLQFLHNKLGFEGMLVVDPIGRSRGLVLFLEGCKLKKVEIQNYSLQHINATITLEGSDFSWKFTSFLRPSGLGKNRRILATVILFVTFQSTRVDVRGQF
jgi:hypothetical protein